MTIVFSLNFVTVVLSFEVSDCHYGMPIAQLCCPAVRQAFKSSSFPDSGITKQNACC